MLDFVQKQVFIHSRVMIEQHFNFSFYLPSIGAYRHYPFTISKTGKIIGDANIYPNEIIVKYPNKVKESDVESWEDVASNDNLEQLKVYFNSISQVDLSFIYHRLKNAPIFELIYNLLEDRNEYSTWLCNYAFYHFRRVCAIRAKDKTKSKRENQNKAEKTMMMVMTKQQHLKVKIIPNVSQEVGKHFELKKKKELKGYIRKDDVHTPPG